MSTFTDYQDMIIADTPLLYWPMNDGGTTVDDFSGNGIHGTINAGSWQLPPVATRRGDYCYFNNTTTANAIASTGTLDTLNASGVSIEFWVYITSNPAAASPSISGGANSLYVEGATSNTIKVGTFAGSFLTGTGFTTNSWFHWVFTQDSAGSSRLYRNGSLLIGPTTLTLPSSDATDLKIWNNASAIPYYMQHLAVYGYELTSTDVTDRYTMAMDQNSLAINPSPALARRTTINAPYIRSAYNQPPNQRWPLGVYVPREIDGNDLDGELDGDA